ncbi:MAG: guanylate kinase [bacterium]
MIIVISAPSGTGKTTICRGLLEEFSDLRFSVSYTTRKPREGETEKWEYKFIDINRFKRMIEKDEFVEWVKIFGDYYGTSRETLEKAKNYDLLLDIDVVGGKKIKASYPESLLIFLLPPSMEELERRLMMRKTESDEKIRERLEKAKYEIEEGKDYDYVIVNERLEKTISLIKEIILKKKGGGKDAI